MLNASSYESKYQHLLFERRDNGVLLVTMNRPEFGNAMNARMHTEMCELWPDLAKDDETRVIVITGAGDDFSRGGELSMVERDAGNFAQLPQSMYEVSNLVMGMVNLDKPIISAINGMAVASGLAIALVADISIISEEARLLEGHVRAGLVCGDHAALIWPMLCSLAKAKLYLLTGDMIGGKEAERIGLVSMCLPATEVLPRALAVADRIGTNAQYAVRWSKRAINNWLRQAAPLFEASMGLELLCLFSDDVPTAMQAFAEGRRPVFPSTTREPGAGSTTA